MSKVDSCRPTSGPSTPPHTPNCGWNAYVFIHVPACPGLVCPPREREGSPPFPTCVARVSFSSPLPFVVSSPGPRYGAEQPPRYTQPTRPRDAKRNNLEARNEAGLRRYAPGRLCFMPAFPEAHIREYLFTAYLVCGSGSVKRHLAKGEEELEGERGRPRNFHVVGLMGLSPFCSRVPT